MAPNVCAWAMFDSGIMARSAHHWQIWVERRPGGRSGTAHALLADIFLVQSVEKYCIHNDWG